MVKEILQIWFSFSFGGCPVEIKSQSSLINLWCHGACLDKQRGLNSTTDEGAFASPHANEMDCNVLLIMCSVFNAASRLVWKWIVLCVIIFYIIINNIKLLFFNQPLSATQSTGNHLS